MTTTILRIISILVLASISAIAQYNVPATNTIWGRSTNGVQLSISVSNIPAVTHMLGPVSPEQLKSLIAKNGLVLPVLTGYDPDNNKMASANFNILLAGINAELFVELKNFSANAISVTQSSTGDAGIPDFVVELIDKSRKVHRLTLEPGPETALRPPLSIKGGETIGWRKLVTVERDIEAGDYVLKATLRFFMPERTFELESNLLKVRVIPMQ
jgi:hypothetical protein